MIRRNSFGLNKLPRMDSNHHKVIQSRLGDIESVFEFLREYT
jgi:hypothetical protein